MSNCTCGEGNGVCDTCLEATQKKNKRTRRDTVECGCIQCTPVEQDARQLLKSTNRVVNTI